MAEKEEPSGAERMFGDFAPGLVHFTDDVLFGEAWERPELPKRDRSLITVAALLTGGNAALYTLLFGIVWGCAALEVRHKRSVRSQTLEKFDKSVRFPA